MKFGENDIFVITKKSASRHKIIIKSHDSVFRLFMLLFQSKMETVYEEVLLARLFSLPRSMTLLLDQYPSYFGGNN